jgi:hypothetical protein
LADRGIDNALKISAVTENHAVLKKIKGIFDTDIASHRVQDVATETRVSLSANDIMVLGANTGLFDGPTALLVKAIDNPAASLNDLFNFGIWDQLCNNLSRVARNGSQSVQLSIQGCQSSVRLVHLVLARDTTKYLPLITKGDLMLSLVSLLSPKQVSCIANWPRELGGGPDSPCMLVDQASTIMHLPCVAAVCTYVPCFQDCLTMVRCR